MISILDHFKVVSKKLVIYTSSPTVGKNHLSSFRLQALMVMGGMISSTTVARASWWNWRVQLGVDGWVGWRWLQRCFYTKFCDICRYIQTQSYNMYVYIHIYRYLSTYTFKCTVIQVSRFTPFHNLCISTP